MADFGLGDMKQIMRACAGVDEAVNLDGDVGDLPFTDLGYDSLAVLEMAAVIQNQYAVVIPEEMINELKTMGEFTDYVRTRLSAA